MTDPQETSADVQSLAHSDGEPNLHGANEHTGSDVGGPAATIESTAEDALTGGTTDNEETDQSHNPL
jgi:hypothetical protein